jgi:ArsR family transcriptional regulator
MSTDMCCTGEINSSLNAGDADLVVPLKALAHPVRLRMFELIASCDNGICVCDIEPAFALSQPTISHHLRLLREAGLVETSQSGTWVFYKVNQSTFIEVVRRLSQVIVKA